MCGIWAIFGFENVHEYIRFFMKISGRGPDAWRMQYDDSLKNCSISFHRLAIVDCIYGMQPMRLNQYTDCTLICNGELYNCEELKKEHGFKYETRCDVECILHLYNKFGIDACVRSLDGVFAFCIVDKKAKKVYLSRDPYGVRPLFTLRTDSGSMAICSEMKGITEITAMLKNNETYNLQPFPPGSYMEFDLLETGKTKFVKQVVYHTPGDKPSFKTFVPWEDLSMNDHLKSIRKLFTMAVKKRLMANRRIGCMLSGGLDSSLTAAILIKEAKAANLPYKIQTFSIGMENSPDLKAARLVADHIGSEHHEVFFTESDVAKVLDEVIYTLETFDITTIRASIGMYLISKYIKENTDSTVLFSGEGADEVAQGYIYFKDAPTIEEGYKDSLRLLREIYLFDGLRADRTVSAHGLELRVPFLDLQFTNYYLNLSKELISPKMAKIEKNSIRAAFDGIDLLPHTILWRNKEAFSDGVTTKKRCLFHIIQDIVDKRISEPFDAEVARKHYPHCTPNTKESLYYRKIFEKHYSANVEKVLPHFWMPKWSKATDPSARFIAHHHDSL